MYNLNRLKTWIQVDVRIYTKRIIRLGVCRHLEFQNTCLLYNEGNILEQIPPFPLCLDAFRFPDHFQL